MIATVACDRCDCWEKKKTSAIAAIIVIIWNNCPAIAAIARWRVVSIWSLNFFFSAMVAIAAITWKPGLIYRNNYPPFLLNCYLYALQTYRTHSSKLRLLLVKLKEYTTWLWFDCVTALAVEMTYPCSLVLACQPTPARLRFLELSASVKPSFPWTQCSGFKKDLLRFKWGCCC